MLIIVIALFVTIVGVGCYWLGTIQLPSVTTATTANTGYAMPFSLGGAGLLICIAKWFISKVILVIVTIFKIIIGFMLLMAAVMGVACLF